MVTLIISAVIVGIIAAVIKAYRRTVQRAEMLKFTNETLLPNLLELETFGFEVRPLDPAIRATLEKGRENKAEYLRNAECCTIEETIAACYHDRENYSHLLHGIAEIKENCNVEIIPYLEEEVRKYGDAIEQQ